MLLHECDTVSNCLWVPTLLFLRSFFSGHLGHRKTLPAGADMAKPGPGLSENSSFLQG